MIKQFIISLSLLFVFVFSVLLHYTLKEKAVNEQMISSLAALTHISTPSLSTAYYEPRSVLHEVMLNPAYPQMQAINRVDFIYAQ